MMVFNLSNISPTKISFLMILVVPITVVSLRHPHLRDVHTRRNVQDDSPRSQPSNRKVDLSTLGKPEERKILIDFWTSTNGEWWTDNTTNNWTVGDHCTNNWMGVTCSGGEVVTIDIVDNNQTGELSESLGGLVALDRLNLLNLLNLRIGGIGGELPASLVNLVNLTCLTIADHSISGEIPALNLPLVREITLYNNKLTG